MKKFLIIAVPVILIVLVAGGVGSYHAMQKIQTFPSNSIKLIREAVAEHDRSTFYNLVDTDKILDTAAKEILTVYINEHLNSTVYSTLEVANLYQNLRAEFLDAAKTAVNDYVVTGRLIFPAEMNEMQKLLKESCANACAIQSYSKPVINDGVARTKIEFYNTELKFGFELEVSLERLNDLEWRVISAKGFDGYFRALERAQKARIDSLNVPVQEQIAEIVGMRGFKAMITEGDEYGFSKTLKIELETDIAADKPIDKLIGRVIIDGRDGRPGITPFTVDMSEYPESGEQTIEVNKILNPFVQQDSDAMKHGLKKSALHVEITEILFLDGTSLKYVEETEDF